MTTLFRTTLDSLRSGAYGQTIIFQSFSKVIVYLLKYVVIFSVVPAVLLLGVATYFIPQLPRLVRDNITPGAIKISQGHFSTTYRQPINLGSTDFVIKINTSGTPADLDNTPSGILVLSDKLIIKTPDSQITLLPMSEFGDLSLSQSQVLAWLTGHQALLWVYSALAIIGLTLLSGIFYALYKLVTFLVWAAIFFTISRIAKKQCSYSDAYKLAVYAAVPPLILSPLFNLLPGYLSFLSLGLFIYLSLSWLWNLTPSVKRPSLK